MSDRILVISAHPDDEVLGCGGTILKHREEGDHVAWMVVTVTHTPRWSEEVVQEKAREVDRVADLYDVSDLFRLELPTILLDSLPLDEVIRSMRPVFHEVGPDTVYLVHPGDVHTDHGVVFRAAWALMKNFRAASTGPRRILLYETLSSTDAAPPLGESVFVANAFSDITPWIDRKIEIASVYASEMQESPLPRSPEAIRSLARYRGASIGVPYAEAFHLLRDLF